MNLYDYLIRNLTHVNCPINKNIIHRTHVKSICILRSR